MISRSTVAVPLSVCCLLLIVGAYGNVWYPGPQTHYPDSYFGPPRTGLASPAYYYPGSYVDSWRSFSHYRQYAFAAYRDPRLSPIMVSGWRGEWR